MFFGQSFFFPIYFVFKFNFNENDKQMYTIQTNKMAIFFWWRENKHRLTETDFRQGFVCSEWTIAQQIQVYSKGYNNKLTTMSGYGRISSNISRSKTKK